MKKVSQRLGIILLVLAAFVLLQACASAPKLPEPKPGLYVNEEFRFSVEYPENWKDDPLQGTEVLRVANPSQFKLPVLTVAVSDLQEGAKLETQGYLDAVKALNPGSKRFKALSEEEIILNDGTPALAFTYKWTWSDGVFKLQGAAVITIKDDKYFSATATTAFGGDTTPEKLLEIVKSWKFY